MSCLYHLDFPNKAQSGSKIKGRSQLSSHCSYFPNIIENYGVGRRT